MLPPLHRLAFLLFAVTPLLSACQADGDPTTDTGAVSEDQNDAAGGNNDENTTDPGGDDQDNDDDAGNDNDDDGDNDNDSEKHLADCEAGADFLPLTKGIRELDTKLEVEAEIDDGCRDCEIIDEKAVIEPNLLKSARMLIPAGILDGAEIIVELDDPRNGIEDAGFLVATPEGDLSSELLASIELSLVNDDRSVARAIANQESVSVYDTTDGYRQLLTLGSGEAFDEIRIRLNGNAESSTMLEVYAACVNRYGWGQD